MNVMTARAPSLFGRRRIQGSRVGSPGVIVNDVHAQLNRTRVARCLSVRSTDELRAVIRRARAEHRAISVSGSRHAMGAQQFGTGTVLLDMRGMRRILEFDPVAGEIEVEAGIQWPELIGALLDLQCGQWPQWGILQKQTGADELTLGGALSANVHGRGLGLAPIVQDVEAFTLMDTNGTLLRCSRWDHPGLFRLVIGGYGLFGIITSVRLRLAPRQKLERVVRMAEVEELIEAFEQRMQDGCLYGDFQFAIDRGSDGFLRRGIFSCYRPVDSATPVPPRQGALSHAEWEELVYLAHVDPREAFERYAAHYLATSGQHYWSDLHQLSPYVTRYHDAVDRRLDAAVRGSEIITELYVPRPAPRARIIPRRRPRGFSRAGRAADLRDDPAHRARRRDVPRVGHAALCVRHLQPAHGAHARGAGTHRRPLPPAHRPGDRLRRELLPHLPPLRHPRADPPVLPAISGVAAAQARPRSGGAIPERLVPLLQDYVS